jgi:A/G-specific adenine glycosylase
MGIDRRVLRWYGLYKRDLPWRKTRDPYNIWISEIIFQQTRINQGLDYYRRFIRKFPDIKTLAQSPVDAVLKQWQGLGYYSRARNLHQAAQYLYRNTLKTLPPEYSELIKLQGIGSYTAAAIASIAFNKPVAVVDGNVYRVLSRFYGMYTPIDSPRAKKIFLEKAQSILDKKNPGDHNQAMMELGALICLPKNARCGDCPVSSDCYALNHKKVNELPVKSKKSKTTTRHFIYLVISDEHKNIYIKKRDTKDIWQGLYDFPLLEKNIGIIKKSKDILSVMGTNKYNIGSISQPFNHKLTHQTIVARFVKINMKSGDVEDSKSWIPVKPAKLKQFAWPKLIENYLPEIHRSV